MSQLDDDREFRARAVEYLEQTYLPRLARALEILPQADLWWRPHPEAVSFGTILLHLEGNVRQWILSGLGDLPDERLRAAEFAAQHDADGATLLARLEETVGQACRVIGSLAPGGLSLEYRIQGFSMSALAAVLHVVEHFSWHVGQAVWIAKARAGAGHGLSFYDEAAINSARNRSD